MIICWHDGEKLLGESKNVTAEFSIVPLDTFDGFVQLIKLCRKHVAVNGDYFEGKQKQFHLVSCLLSFRWSLKTLLTVYIHY